MSLRWLERHPGRTFVALGVMFLAAYVTAVVGTARPRGRILDGDAVQYYVYLRSLVFDRDVNFLNDYALIYGLGDEPSARDWRRQTTATGHAFNLWSIGPAILWAPLFLVTCAGVWLGRVAGADVPLDGIAAPFQASAGAAGVVYAALGAWLIYRTCALLFPASASFWGTLVAWLATPAIYYSLISPGYSHATSLFAVALFTFAWIKTRGDERVGRYAMLGALGGLVALVRWQDGLVLLMPAMTLAGACLRDPRRSWGSVVRLLALGIAAALLLLPQLLAWRAIFGEFLVIPQGTSFMRWLDPSIGGVLFSTRHGLFTWTPAVLPAVVGLWWLARRDAGVGWPVAIVVLLSVYVNAAVADWWAGEAFGARRFVGDTVFFAMGLAAVIDGTGLGARPGLLRSVATSVIAYNVLFVAQYQAFMHGWRDLSPYPVTARQIFVDRFVIPWRLLHHWLGW